MMEIQRQKEERERQAVEADVNRHFELSIELARKVRARGVANTNTLHPPLSPDHVILFCAAPSAHRVARRAIQFIFGSGHCCCPLTHICSICMLTKLLSPPPLGATKLDW